MRVKAITGDPVSQSTHAAARLPIVALAASAGGQDALTHVLGHLPADFPAAIVVVQHLDPSHRSFIAEILGRRSHLRVKQAEDGDLLRPGVVFIAPPDRHLIVNADNSLSLAQTERLHFVRPSADRLFESVAAAAGPRAVAVVLTGMGNDGSDGVLAVKREGGVVIVQDRASSKYFGMPSAALRAGCVDLVLPLDRIGPTLAKLVAPEGVA
jgi:two-component system chemotaxis response regulator CheB